MLYQNVIRIQKTVDLYRKIKNGFDFSSVSSVFYIHIRIKKLTYQINIDL